MGSGQRNYGGGELISVRHLSVRLGTTQALENVNLDIEAGECLLITGPTGCGKSTLVRALTGLIPHAISAEMSGSVTIAGIDTRQHTISELAQVIGVVFQNPSAQLFHLRVEDEVAFGPRNLGLPLDEIHERVEWALDSVGLQHLRLCRPSELSGGQKQLVAIAAALALKPRVLILDEPTASLDVLGTHHVLTALHELRSKHGITIILIEHRLAMAAQLADRVLVMDQGRELISGETDKVFKNWQLLKQLGLRRPVEEQLSPWNRLLVPNGQPPVGIRPLVDLCEVVAGYQRIPVLHGVSFTILPGEFIALVGDNGAGKSTLGLVAAGLLKPFRGKVLYEGQNRPRPGLEVSMLFQNPCEQLFTDTVDEEVAFGPRNYRQFNPETHHKTMVEADLLALSGRHPPTLSMGQQQRTVLGACLSLRPNLLILDEPTLGQDWGHLERLMNFLVCLNKTGMTILLITHDFKLIHRYAQRVVWMKGGRIVLDGRLKNGDVT